MIFDKDLLITIVFIFSYDKYERKTYAVAPPPITIAFVLCLFYLFLIILFIYLLD